MGVRNKEDAAMVIGELRKEIRGKMEAELLKEYAEKQKEGKYPYEGMWLEPHEVVKLQKKLKIRDRIVLAEVLILYVLFGLSLYVVYRLMKIFLLPR